MISYRHIFFDLDHTLWDFENNARHVLRQLYQQFLSMSQFSEQRFIDVYEAVNQQLWIRFNQGEIDKHQLRAKRFDQTFTALGVDPAQFSLSSQQFDEWFLEHCSQMSGVFPGCHQCLAQLHGHFQLHLITNGFSETQYNKLRSANLNSYFDRVFISDELGMHKPNPDIFEHAMVVVGATASECLMVGDSLEADIAGARGVGIDQVWFNPKSQASSEPMTYQIQQLSQLPPWLGIDHG
ncbi:YjjG family noncanonical pyrimidine nucleotidase [Celerinatantimonas yamalensis]|uniref:YjjG family noncanonical pyrimidine nucleotidase n=1 Tax=Celerinatantimonas yamalensis TaxID=559956 RepID=A0ABW9G4T2_9GAMM